ncbi:MAG: cytosine permease [Planctomycetia bacterium]|nr:cytosine permease [Planctomycetia bacterium]
MATNLPDYVSLAKPNPAENRAAWWKNTAQTYAGIMLWFVFWQSIPTGDAALPGGMLGCGVATAIAAIFVSAFLCYLLFYLAPAMLGMKSGLSLTVVGTSTYGTTGGFLMPGFLMGVLQFGWLAVNAYFSGLLLAGAFGMEEMSSVHLIIASLWAIAAAFIGLKGIKYVAPIASFLPLIPVVILIVLLAKTSGGIAEFDQKELVTQQQTLTEGAKTAGASTYGVFNILGLYILGFFATAGAAGCNMGTANRNRYDVHMGGLVGVFGATLFAATLSLLVYAGAYGSGILAYDAPLGNTPSIMGAIMGNDKIGSIFMTLLAVSAFPSACFAALIAADNIKTTLPKINPFITCGIGTLAAIALILSGKAGQAAAVFTVIGASFGPICGAMTADYILSGFRWNGPRAGFNPAGWISWLVGFVVGAFNFIECRPFDMPCPPLLAFVVGFVLYFLLAKMGLESKSLEMKSKG